MNETDFKYLALLRMGLAQIFLLEPLDLYDHRAVREDSPLPEHLPDTLLSCRIPQDGLHRSLRLAYRHILPRFVYLKLGKRDPVQRFNGVLVLRRASHVAIADKETTMIAITGILLFSSITLLFRFRSREKSILCCGEAPSGDQFPPPQAPALRVIQRNTTHITLRIAYTCSIHRILNAASIELCCSQSNPSGRIPAQAQETLVNCSSFMHAAALHASFGVRVAIYLNRITGKPS